MHEQERRQRYWQRREQINWCPITREKDHSEKRDRERDPDDRFVHVRHRWPAGDEATHHDPTGMKQKTERRNYDSKILKDTRAFAQVRDDQGKKSNAVQPDRAIKSFEMIVEVFQPQLSIFRINRQTQRA